jgi:excinuclease ABC subunit C
MELPEKIKQKLSALSSRPGVYLMRDRFGRVIYVGKANALNRRVRSYFQLGRISSMDPKTRALVAMAADIDTYEVRNETEAILLEGKLIKQYKPKYNIAFRDDKRFLLVKLTRDTFPRFVLTRLQKRDGCRYFGPFIHSTALRKTMDYLRRNFHIRTCQTDRPDEYHYKHCMNDILQDCSAPCVARVTPEEYQRWVERACDFLEGKDEEALQQIEAEMRKAAERKDYERAAVLRDALHDLRQTVKQSARKFARDMPQHQNPETELQALCEALTLPHPPRTIEGFDISHIHGTHTVGSMVHFCNGRPIKSNFRHFNIRGANGPSNEILVQNDDYASMREIVGRRYRRLRDEEKSLPDLVLIDGGRPQLNAALLALKEVGVSLNVIGLAKAEEEIYLPSAEKPLKLPQNSPALHLLQRIRDESHRFANSFHESWRRKQIHSSILDELSGIGERRKQALLQKFGSLERLRKADVIEISQVEGFGEKTAELLWRFLHPKEITPSKKS